MTDKEMKDMDETNEIDKTAMDETAANEIAEAVENGTDTDAAAAAEDPATTGAEAAASTDTNATDDPFDVVEDDLQFDVDFDDETAETDDASETVDEAAPVDEAVPVDGGADVAAANADRVNATLDLAMPHDADDDASPLESQTPRSATSVTAVSSHIDREVGVGDEDLKLLRSYPTLSLHNVTYRDRKTGRAAIENLTCTFEAGTLAAFLVPDGDTMAQSALVGLLSGLTRPESGRIMNRSAAYDEIEPLELRGHRVGLATQRFAVRDDLSPVQNLVYAMDASNRNFLKPKPVLAREQLLAAGLGEELLDARVGTLGEADRRRVAIARALCCEAEIVVIDEPVEGLEDDERDAIIGLLRAIAHGDPKRCVVVVTQDAAAAESVDQSVTL